MFRMQQFRITPETLPPQRGKLATALTHWWHLCLSSPNSWESSGQCNTLPAIKGVQLQAPLPWDGVALRHSKLWENSESPHTKSCLLFNWKPWRRHYFESLWLQDLPNQQTCQRNKDTWSKTQARNKMLFTTSNSYIQHKARAFSGLLKKRCEEFQ